MILSPATWIPSRRVSLLNVHWKCGCGLAHTGHMISLDVSFGAAAVSVGPEDQWASSVDEQINMDK